MKVVAFDINDIANPRKIFEVNLHGRGDGVVVKDNFIYAVSGQHGKNIKNLSDINDPEYGNGNGISIFDISQNYKEVFFDNFGKGYSISIDTWKPIICEDYLVCCDSIMGVHVYDLRNNKKIDEIKFGKTDDKEEAVTSAVSSENSLYITTAYGGIYKYNKLEFGNSYNFCSDKIIDIKKEEFDQHGDFELKKLYSGEFSVLSVCDFGKYYAIACGSDGMHIVDKKFKLVYKIKKEGFCCDVKAFGDYIIGAFSESGVFIYKINDSSLDFISSFTSEKAIQQISLSKNNNYIACCLESTEVIMLDITEIKSIRKVYSRKAKFGPLYGENFASTHLSDGTMVMFWHRDGVVYSNPETDTAFNDIFYKRNSSFMCFGPETGFDTDGKNMFYNLNGGYVILPFECTNVDNLKIYKTKENLNGKFIICDEKIIAVERAEGVIAVVDISDKENPKFFGKIHTTASCSKPVFINGKVFVPAWHDGLLELAL